MKKYILKEKGITLVALVVTIIILLILAGVTISSAINNGGLFGKAANATSTYKQSATKEQADLESLMTQIDESASGNSQYSETKKVNVPKLTNGMIPIKYNGTSWVICSSDDSTWYNYVDTNNNGTVDTSEMQWANVMLSDGKYKTSNPSEYKTDGTTTVADSDLGSMFVWIPRYAYSISKYKTSANGEGTTQKITDVTFLKGATNQDAKGNSYNIDYDANNVTEGQATPKIVHPGFKFGDTNVTGLWVAKFEASMVETNNNTGANNNVTNKTIKVKPNTETWRYIQVGNCFANCLNMKAENNAYGISANTTNSHLMKNSEWGAVAYLCESQYAITPTFDNSGSNYTEDGATKYHSYSGGYNGTNGYKENITQSTTGNITGIYDLNGGAWEYVAAYYDNSDGNVGGQGTSNFFTNNVLKSEYSNYWDTYQVGNDEKTIYGPNRSKLWDVTTNITENNTIRKRITDERYNLMKASKGDAMYEVMKEYSYYGKRTDGNYDWIYDTSTSTSQYKSTVYNSDYSLIGNCALPFLVRGGNWWGGSLAGVFASGGSGGYTCNDFGFRPVLWA